MAVIGRASVQLFIGGLGYPISECSSVSVIGRALFRLLIGGLGYPVSEYRLVLLSFKE